MESYNNPQLKLAFEFVQYTGRNIFLTGKAGTGKTTFLKNLKDSANKRMVVVAPTGVAAINAGGVTIHSFFQLPFGPIIPDELVKEQDNLSFRKFSKQKINIIKTIDLLIIDEISMVRADLLDGIDSTLRRFRKKDQPFGGVQLLMIGDLQQLAPVVKENEWSLLRNHYSTSFFFGSIALQKTNYVSIELEHVFRQSDQTFIDLLNKIRENKTHESVISTLNNRYIPNNQFSDDGYITLTTHNAKAKEINDRKLAEIKGKSSSFLASVSGNFPEYAYPNDFDLKLKVGAQVMFVKNDPSPEKRYFNGKIGVITGFHEDSIEVDCDGEDEPIYAEKLTWEKVKYSINESSGEIKEEIEGFYNQYPLKLAWAITIHKSQGLTFDNAIIDAESAFAHGQVYVALSRCRTLEGMVLSSRIAPTSVFIDSTIDKFTSNIEQNQPDQEHLIESKKQYQIDVLTDLFDFVNLQKFIYYLIKILKSNYSAILGNPLDDFTTASKIISEDIVLIGKKFQGQIQQLGTDTDSPEENSEIQDRIKKGSKYFLEKTKLALEQVLTAYEPETDNKAVRKVLKSSLENVDNEYRLKISCLDFVKNGFILSEYLNHRALALLNSENRTKKSKTKSKVLVNNDANPELFRILKAWRNSKASELKWEVYRIIQLKTIREICYFLPSVPDELSEMSGMGKKKMELFSDELLDIINDYRGEYKVSGEPIILSKKPKKKEKKNTKLISFELYQEGNKIDEIAEKRGLNPRTIESHLAEYVRKGEIPVTDFVKPEIVKKILQQVVSLKTTLLSEVKNKLDDNITYPEIKFVIEHMKFKKIIE